MKLTVRHKDARSAIVKLDGVKQTQCIVADSDKGYVERKTGKLRRVGLVTKEASETVYGEVTIEINGKLL